MWLSLTTCIIIVVVSMLKVQNKFEQQCVLLNLVAYFKMSCL